MERLGEKLIVRNLEVLVLDEADVLLVALHFCRHS